MFIDVREIEQYLAGKRLALCFFNKDARNLLRAHAAGLAPFPFSIEALVDPTLRYRPRVRELAEAVIDPGRIITDQVTFASVVEARAFDTALLFEAGYENQPQDHLLRFAQADLQSFEDLVAKCKLDFDNYRAFDPNAEFNARWSRFCVEFLAEYFSQRGVQVISAYNIPSQKPRANDRLWLSFVEHHAMLPTMPASLAEVPVRFVLGEDWACGKTSYLIDRMAEGASGLAGDFWFRLVSPDAIPTFRMEDMFAIKGVIANQIRRAHERNPGHPVFVKYDGRLEEFVFGIPRDRTYLLQDMHHYFRDCRVVIVHKADSPRMRDMVARFTRKYAMPRDRIDCVRIGVDGRVDQI